MIDPTYVLAFIFIMFRLSAFFMMVPVFFPSGTPNIVKISFTAIIAFLLLPVVDNSIVHSINNSFGIFVFTANEVITGIILGYLTKLCFEFIRMAGQLMDFHIGFSMSNFFDPSIGENVTLIGRITYLFGVLIFLLIDGHHMLIRALAHSFDVIQLGKFMLSNKSIMLVLEAFISFFKIGVMISIPITIIILMTNLILGLVSRSVPQINVMILGLPIKILVGLLSFSIAIPILIKMMLSGFDNIPHIINTFFKTAPLMIIFADSGGEKTEEATPKKKSDAKKKGQVARSKEIGLAFTLLVSTLVLAILGNRLVSELGRTIYIFFNDYLNLSFTYNSIFGVLIISLYRIMVVFLPFAVPIMLIGIAISYMQTGYVFTLEPLKPDLKKLNPITGLKKLFSVRSIFEMFKSLVIVCVLIYVGYKFLIGNYNDILNFANIRIEAVTFYMGKLTVSLFFKISLIMIVIAIADFAFQRRQHKKDLRMSKQEIKEEFKQMEGDPLIKSKIKEKQRSMAMKRMMQNVPDATVVVTNPTHFAVAIRYDEKIDEAPVVIAKGADYVSLKIKEIAKENNVPIIENKPLARLLYKEVDIDEEIPSDMYQAVAEILAIVYRLKYNG